MVFLQGLLLRQVILSLLRRLPVISQRQTTPGPTELCTHMINPYRPDSNTTLNQFRQVTHIVHSQVIKHHMSLALKYLPSLIYHNNIVVRVIVYLRHHQGSCPCPLPLSHCLSPCRHICLTHPAWHQREVVPQYPHPDMSILRYSRTIHRLRPSKCRCRRRRRYHPCTRRP